MAAPIVPLEIANHTHALTSASDWPMFMFLFVIIQGLVAILMRSYHNTILDKIQENHGDVLERISTQKTEDTARCRGCKSDHDMHTERFLVQDRREKDALWKNLTELCKANNIHPITVNDLRKQESGGN
jgi:hypothetical protein